MAHVALIGTGTLGASWAVVFARAGLTVAVHDADAAAADKVRDFVRQALADFAAQGVGSREVPDAILARITAAASLEQAVEGAIYVQESVFERLDVKVDLYRRLDTIAAPELVIGSSTSGLPASAFTEEMVTRNRCLVVHPLNPPHLIPLVEIVPSPWTEARAVEVAADMMARVGQSPIRLAREVNGFVVNRLQGAVLAEAFRLVEDGIVSALDVDRAVTDGLGLRWLFLGPFATIDLNARGGIAEYCRSFGPMYQGLSAEQADPRPWPPALVSKVEQELRTEVPAEALSDRRSWRDRYLARIANLKAEQNIL